MGSESNPIRVNDASDLTSVEVEAGAEVYYSISSFLYGQVLTVEAAEGVEVSLNGTKLTAVDGEYVVVLTGGPSASLVVKNAGETAAELAANINWPLGSESNPIVVENANQLTSVVVGAESEVYYAISSKLNDKVLTIVAAEGVTVTLNGKELEAKNGVYTAVLDAAPANKLVVKNVSKKAAELTASVEAPLGSEENPIVIENVSDLTNIVVDKSSTAYYVISSKLNGMLLTIEEDAKTVITLNGVELKAEDGVYTIVLEGTPANKLVVKNNRPKKAIDLEASITEVIDDPDTGDTFNMIPVLMMVFAAVAFVVVSKKRQAI